MDWGWWEDKPPKKIFDGLVFSISLQNESMSVRKQVADAIKKNGGTVAIGQPKELTHLVAGEREINENGLKIRNAYKNKSFVVLPSFVHDSIRYGQKLQEWSYTMIAGKPARQIARDEEEMVMTSLQKGLGNVYALIAGTEYVEQNVQKAVSKIRSLCLEIAHNGDLELEHLARLPLNSQIAETFENLSDNVEHPSQSLTKNKVKRNLKETAVYEPAIKTSAFDIASAFSTQSILSFPSFGISTSVLTNKKPTALQLQIEAKKQERAEKQRKIEEEKKRKEEERKKKEAERLQRQEEARKKSEELRLRLEESQRKLDFATQFLEFGGFDMYEREEDDGMTEEKRLQLEEEKKKQEEKLARKALKHEKKLRNKVDHILKHREMRQNRLAKKDAQKKQIEEEKKQKALEKEIARKEYAERQERKRQKMLQGEAPPPPTDDNRKLYVGGIKFDDLKRLPKKLNAATELAVKKERIKNLVKLFEKFGPVEKLKDTILAKGYGFIVYKQPESVEKALAVLGKFEEREKLTKEMKAQLEAQGGKTLAMNAPNAHFYIRVVHSMSGKKKAFNANEKMKEKTSKKHNQKQPQVKEGKQEVTS